MIRGIMKRRAWIRDEDLHDEDLHEEEEGTPLIVVEGEILALTVGRQSLNVPIDLIC